MYIRFIAAVFILSVFASPSCRKNRSSSSANVTVNQPPAISPPVENIVINQDQTIVIVLVDHKTDDRDDPLKLTWSIENYDPSQLQIDVSGDEITITSLIKEDGTHTFTLVLHDSEGLTAQQDIMISIVAKIEIEVDQGYNPAIMIDDGIANHHSVRLVYNKQKNTMCFAYVRRGFGFEMWYAEIDAFGKILRTFIGDCREYSMASLAIDSQGKAAIAFDTTLVMIDDGNISSENIPALGGNPVVAFDPSDDSPVIAMNSSGIDHNLYYLQKNNNWDPEFLSRKGAIYQSLNFNPLTGERSISFTTLSALEKPGTIRFFDRQGDILVDGETEFIDIGNSLDFDSNGNPHIVYMVSSYKIIRYAWRGSAGWHVDTLDDRVFTGGKIPSIVISPDNKIYVGYNRENEATGQDALSIAFFNGATWEKTLVAKIQDQGIGDWVSLALNNHNKIHAAFVALDKIWLVSAK